MSNNWEYMVIVARSQKLLQKLLQKL